MLICRAKLHDTCNALTIKISGEHTRLKAHLNCSESTAESHRWSGSEYQTVGLATENARVPEVLQRTRDTVMEVPW